MPGKQGKASNETLSNVSLAVYIEDPIFPIFKSSLMRTSDVSSVISKFQHWVRKVIIQKSLRGYRF